jgi:methylase of polypeptide subunit release factors
VTGIAPLLAAPHLDALRSALAEYTVDGVEAAIGLAGRSALARDDLDGLRGVLGADRLDHLIGLFLLGDALEESTARRLLAPFTLEAGLGAGLLETRDGAIAAGMELRPYGEDGPESGDSSWLVLSDFGSDVRPGPVSPDHVLGIGAAALTLAQATVRPPVARALDIGTGCGVQALHLSGHADEVIATDVSDRALRLAATTAALNGLSWQLRSGSLLEPVAAERFDLIVANPPFVVSPGRTGDSDRYDYRDSGLAGDDVSRLLVSGLADHLTEGGTAQLLANWVITPDQDWDERVTSWLTGDGCDAWVWQREVAEPGEYVTMWLRDAGERPGTPSWREQYRRWVDWLRAERILGIGMGLVTIRRTGSGTPVVVCEEVPQVIEQPSGPHIRSWLDRQRWLAEHTDEQLLDRRLIVGEDVVLATTSVPDAYGWSAQERTLRQQRGLRWEVDTDEAIAALLAGCSGEQPLGAVLAVVAAGVGAAAADVARAALPVVRDLVGRGFLRPVS